MDARPLAVVAQRNSQADHRFPEWLARTLEALGWRVEWIPANLTRLQFTRALSELRSISRNPVFWAVNYRSNLAKWTSLEGLTCITWNEVFPISYQTIKAMHHSEHSWFFCSSKRLLDHFRGLGVQAHFVPWGFEPSVFFPKNQELRYNISFVGSGLNHTEKGFSDAMSQVCDGLESEDADEEKLCVLSGIAGFFQLFLRSPWEVLERYRGDVASLMSAYCEGLSLPEETKQAVAQRLHALEGHFLGQYARFQRLESVHAMSALPGFAIFGRGWEDQELEPWLQAPLLYNDTARVFGQSRINVHLHRLYMDGINDRMINIPATGGLLLTRDTPQLQSVLSQGEHYVGFQTVEELKDKATWLLEDEDSRSKIAAAGCRYVHEHLTMRHQLRKILNIVGLDDPSRRSNSRSTATDRASLPKIPKDSVRMAVIGHGSMGRHHARVIDELPGAELVALVDSNTETLPKFAQRYGCRIFTSLDDLLEHGSVDAISIAVPTSMHEEIARRALLAGVHVLVEKPIASTVDQALEIESLAASSQAKLMVGHIERFNPAIRALKAKIEQGALGKIFHFEAHRQGPYPGRIMDVGAAVDLAVHDIDIIRFLSGQEIRQVYAQAHSRISGPHEDAIHSILKLGRDMVASLSVNWVTPTKIRKLSVVGESGMFLVDYISQDLLFYENGLSKAEPWHAVSLFRGVDEGQVIRHHIPKSEPLRNELEHFIDCIRNDRDPMTTANDGVRALTIAQSVLESSRLGTSLDLEFSNTGSHLCVAA